LNSAQPALGVLTGVLPDPVPAPGGLETLGAGLLPSRPPPAWESQKQKPLGRERAKKSRVGKWSCSNSLQGKAVFSCYWLGLFWLVVFFFYDSLPATEFVKP